MSREQILTLTLTPSHPPRHLSRLHSRLKRQRRRMVDIIAFPCALLCSDLHRVHIAVVLDGGRDADVTGLRLGSLLGSGNRLN
eukprot:7316164-Prymnesium_polylepis.2